MIDLYAVNISTIEHFDQISGLQDYVSAKRKMRIERYCFEKDKIRCLLAEILLKYALVKQYGKDINEIRFCYTDKGKPLLVDEDIHFNVSHAGDWVICALGDTTVGVDIERICWMDFESIYRNFSRREIRFLDSVENEIKPDMFYKLWTLKESYVKYDGSGLSYPFESFSIIFENTKIPLLMKNGVYDEGISFFSAKMDDHHWYAVCTESTEDVHDLQSITLQDVYRVLLKSVI